MSIIRLQRLSKEYRIYPGLLDFIRELVRGTSNQRRVPALHQHRRRHPARGARPVCIDADVVVRIVGVAIVDDGRGTGISHVEVPIGHRPHAISRKIAPSRDFGGGAVPGAVRSPESAPHGPSARTSLPPRASDQRFQAALGTASM